MSYPDQETDGAKNVTDFTKGGRRYSTIICGIQNHWRKQHINSRVVNNLGSISYQSDSYH